MGRHDPKAHVVLVRRDGGDRGSHEDLQRIRRVEAHDDREDRDQVRRGAGHDVHGGRDDLGHREDRIRLVFRSRDGHGGCHSGHGGGLLRHRSLSRMDLLRCHCHYRYRYLDRSSRRPSHRRVRDEICARRGEEGCEVPGEEVEGYAGELEGRVEEGHDEAGHQGRQRAGVPMTKDRMDEAGEHPQIEDRVDLRLTRCRCCDLGRSEQRTGDCCLAAQG